MHPVDSNEISFRLAGRNAFGSGIKEAGPKLLEPIYDVIVQAPSDRLGDMMSDLQGADAPLLWVWKVIRVSKDYRQKIPLKELSSYSTTLISLTGGVLLSVWNLQATSWCQWMVRINCWKYEVSKKRKNNLLVFHLSVKSSCLIKGNCFFLKWDDAKLVFQRVIVFMRQISVSVFGFRSAKQHCFSEKIMPTGI